ncbi:MAG: GerMN domain-containing protein [Eubacterium sp.]|nr:GerMN domain-containing protein [Eubacterium sp.]
MKIRRILSLILMLSLTISLFGCGEAEKEQTSGMFVYFINKAGDDLNKEEYRVKSDNANSQITDLLDALSKDGDDKGDKAAVPENVIVNGFKLENGIITVDFNSEYNQLENQREVMCRAAVVLTLIQINAVDGIEFTVEDKPYEKVAGSRMGIMDASSFVSMLRGGDDQFARADFLLYFGNDEGAKLKKYELKNANYGNKSKEEFIVRKLISGPDKDGYTATLNKNVRLRSVSTSNNICYVDFDDSFLRERSGVLDEVCIYSIVNSLCELNDIHEVQITVNRDSDIMYHKKISLSEPLIRNLDIVETE